MRGKTPVARVFRRLGPDRLFGREVGTHEVITFGYAPGLDIQISLATPFTEVLHQLPADWLPDVCVCVHADFLMIPPGIEDAPFPTVAATADWDYRVGVARSMVDAFDLVVGLGEESCRTLATLGARRTLPFSYFGFPERWMRAEPTPIAKDRPIDVLFTGTIADHTHPDRSQWLARLARLSDRHHIYIDDSSKSPEEYLELLRQTRLVFTFHRRGELQVRFTDAVVEGACPLDNGIETANYFDPATEYAAYDEHNFEAQIERHLADEQLRRRKVEAARNKVLARFGSVQRIADLFDAIERELPSLNPAERAARQLGHGEKNRRSAAILYADQFDRWLGPRAEYLPLAAAYAERAEPGPRRLNDLAVILTSQALQGAAADTGQRALQLFQTLTEEHPRYAVGWFNRAYALEVSQQTSAATECFCQAYELLVDPSADGEFDAWALYCREQDRQAQSFRKPLIDACLEIARGGRDERARQLIAANCAFFVGRSRRREGQWHEAAKLMNIASQLDPANSAVASNAAHLADLLGHYDDAARHYWRLLDIHPLDVPLRLAVVQFLLRQQQTRVALDLFRETIQLVPAVRRNNGLCDQLAAMSQMLSMNSKGLKALADLPLDRFANDAITELCSSMGDHPDPRVLARVHELLIAQGKHEAAEQWHRRYGLPTGDPRIPYAQRDQHLVMLQARG